LIIFIYFHLPASVKPVPISPKELILVMDIPGIILGMGALVSFTLAMQWGGTLKPWSSPDVIGIIVGCVVMIILFVVLQWRAGENASLVTRIMTQRTVAALSAFIFLFVQYCKGFFSIANDMITASIRPTFSLYTTYHSTFRSSKTSLLQTVVSGTSRSSYQHHFSFLPVDSSSVELDTTMLFSSVAPLYLLWGLVWYTRLTSTPRWGKL